MGLGQASHHLQGCPQSAGAPSVFVILDEAGKEERQDIGERPVPCQPWQCRDKETWSALIVALGAKLDGSE